MTDNKKNIIFLIIFFVLGLLIRIWLIKIGPQHLFWDMQGYSDSAQTLLSGRLLANCCSHGPVYPFFLAGIYKLFGIENLLAVHIVQLILELLIAGIIYIICFRVFGKKTALYSTSIYLINPFTSPFPGLILTEELAFLLVILIAYVVSRKMFEKRGWLSLCLGILLGLMAFNRPAFMYLIFPLVGGLIFQIAGFFHKVKFVILVGLGFLIISTYSLYANYITYHKFYFGPPYTNELGIFYLNFYQNRETEYLYGSWERDPVFAEYEQNYWYYINNQPDKFTDFKVKYNQLFWQKIKTDWPQFIYFTLRNDIWMWDKFYIFTVNDPYYPADSVGIRILNILLIILFATGIMSYLKFQKSDKSGKRLAIFSLVLFGYMLILFPLGTSNPRYTMPFYPIFILWSGKGLNVIIELIRKPRL
jgi:4-amino-4-deoxy-L-arabinose transferase-like glycosyltransferase